MKRIWHKIQEGFEKDPEKMLLAAAAVLGSTAMVINAYSNAKGRRTWNNEVQRRYAKDMMSPRYPFSR